MSVYISMEMPTTCFECPFMFARRYCRADLMLDLYQGDYEELKGRVDGCPLIEVPPHGKPTHEEPQTNADRIRAMLDEELAEKMSELESFALTCGCGWPPEKWLDWLKRPVNKE